MEDKKWERIAERVGSVAFFGVVLWFAVVGVVLYRRPARVNG